MLTAAFALLFAPVSARLVNYTVDDGLGDQRTHRLPDYISNTVWKARSQADGCTSNCGLNIDLQQVHDGTWHGKETHADEKPSYVSLNFNGTTIYVYCVLANNIGIAAQDTRLSFYFDGASNPAGDFLHTADTKVDGFLYNQLVFASEALDSGPHTLVVKSSAEGDSGSLFVFDYALYTTEIDDDDASGVSPTNTSPAPSASTEPQTGDPTASPDEGNRHSHVGPIVGGAIAGVAVASAVVALALWMRSKRRRRAQPASMFLSDARDARGMRQRRDGSRGSGTPTSTGASSILSQSYPTSHTIDEGGVRRELESLRRELARVRKIAEPPNYAR